MSVRIQRRDVAAIVAASLAFATSGPLGTLTTRLPPVTIAALRTAIAAGALVLVMPRAFARALAALSPKQRTIVGAAGALLAGHFTLWFYGLARTSLAAAVALISLEPLFVVLASFVWHRIVPTRRELVGLVVAMAGAVVVASGAGIGAHRLDGDAMVLGCGVLYGAYVASARSLREAMPALPYAGAVYGTAAMVLAPLAFAAGLPSPTRAESLAIVGIAFVPTLIGHTLMNVAARRAPPVLVALVCPGETLGSLAIGAFVLGAPPTPREAAGAVVVLAGAMLATTWRGR